MVENATGGDPANDAPKKKIVCEFCESRLAPNGDTLELSEKAKKFRKLSEDNTALKLENDRLGSAVEARDAEIVELKRTRTDPPPPQPDAPPKKKPFLFQ